MKILCVLVIKSEEKIPLGRPRGCWEDNTKMCIVFISRNIAQYIYVYIYINLSIIIIIHKNIYCAL